MIAFKHSKSGRQRTKGRYASLALLLAMASQSALSFANTSALRNAEHAYSKILPLCAKANRERRRQPMEAQLIYDDYETQYKAILASVPNFNEAADQSIRAEIETCKKVKDSIAYERAKLEMHRAIKICQSVETAFKTNNLVQAENLLQRYEQQKQRAINTHSQINAMAEIKAEMVRCQKRSARAQQWRTLMNQTAKLLRSNANCERLSITLREDPPVPEATIETVRTQLAQTQALLTRVQEQVTPMLRYAEDLSSQTLTSYDNSIAGVDACITSVTQTLDAMDKQKLLAAEKKARKNKRPKLANELPPKTFKRPTSEMLATLSTMMNHPSAKRPRVKAKYLKRHCRALINAAKAPRITADELAFLGRAKAQFIIVLAQLKPKQYTKRSLRNLDDCAVDLAVEFVSAEARLLETMRLQDNKEKMAPLPPVTAPTSDDTTAKMPTAAPRPLLNRLKKLRLWRAEDSTAP